MKYLITFSLVVISFCHASSQEEQFLHGEGQWLSSLSVLNAYIFQDRTEFSDIGFEYQLSRHGESKLGFQMSLGYYHFDRMDESLVPLLLGLHYRVVEGEKYNLRVMGKFGASGTIGNDYGGFFAASEFGLQYNRSGHKGIIATLSWANTVAFHPSHYAFIKAGVGWVF